MAVPRDEWGKLLLVRGGGVVRDFTDITKIMTVSDGATQVRLRIGSKPDTVAGAFPTHVFHRR